MRFVNLVCAAALCGGVGLLATSASAERLNNEYDIIDSKTDDNFCFVGAEGIEFFAGGDVSGPGNGNVVNTIVYFTPTPTNANANSKKIAVKQNGFSTLDFLADNVSVSDGPQVVEKCNVNGNVSDPKFKGKVTVSCKGDNLNSILDANDVASFQAAFGGNPRVKIKVNQNTQKWSLKITCNGDVD